MCAELSVLSTLRRLPTLSMLCTPFQKKSQKTAQRDLDLAAARWRDLKRELRS